MAFKLPPPPLGEDINSFVWKDWLNRLKEAFTNLLLGVDQGGTGLDAVGNPGEVLGVDDAGTALEYKAIEGTNGIGINNSNGVITISNELAGAYMLYEEPDVEVWPTASGATTTSSGGGTSGLTHPEVLTRVSFRF